jgi:hypothetical protein
MSRFLLLCGVLVAAASLSGSALGKDKTGFGAPPPPYFTRLTVINEGTAAAHAIRNVVIYLKKTSTNSEAVAEYLEIRMKDLPQGAAGSPTKRVFALDLSPGEAVGEVRITAERGPVGTPITVDLAHNEKDDVDADGTDEYLGFVDLAGGNFPVIKFYVDPIDGSFKVGINGWFTYDYTQIVMKATSAAF